MDENVNKEYLLGIFNFIPGTRSLYLGKDLERRLTAKESQLLKMLVDAGDEILPRNTALREIWGDVDYFKSRSMDVYIVKLRKYLSSDLSLEIMNYHGKGFKLLINKTQPEL